MSEQIDIERRFWNRVDRRSAAECWPWTGNLNHQGYGRLQVNRKNMLGHRLSYMLNVGSIMPGEVIDHLCENKRCVNPAHLEAVSPKVNTVRHENSWKPEAQP